MPELLGQLASPGQCPPEGCPPPTEIVCISVPKLYDFCFEQDNGLTNCIAIPFDGDSSPPPVCGIPPDGATATCSVTDVRCTAGKPVPTGAGGFSAVAIVVAVRYDVSIVGTNCARTITGSTFVFTRTVILCAPPGTTADCFAQVACGPCMILPPSVTFPAGQVCCGFGLCLLVESSATVRLLVPSYGFCTPAACQQGPFPPFTCPPSEIFPPQCDFPSAD